MNGDRSRVAIGPTLRRFARELALAAPRQALASAFVMAALSVTEGVGILLLVPLLALVGVDAGQGALQGLAQRFAALFSAVGVRPTLPGVLIVYVVLAVAQSGLQRWQTMLTLRVQQEFMTAMRTRVYRAMANAQWVFLARNRSADAMHALTAEIDRTGNAAYYLVTLCVSAVVAAVYLGVAVRLSPGMTGFVLLCGAGLAWAIRGQLARSREAGEYVSTSTNRVYSAISEHLASMKTAKSYGRAGEHADAFEALAHEVRDGQLAAMDQWTGVRQRLTIGVPVVLAVVVYVSHSLLHVPNLSLFVLLFLFARLMPRLTGLYENLQTFITTLPGFVTVCEFEDRCRAAAEAAEPADGRSTDVTFQDELRFEHVTFAYPDTGQPAVRDLEFAIRAGATTAIVGPSGAGKSTVADLLLGLLTPARGRIVVDGRELGPEHLSAWRARIAYVPQDTFLFHDTVRANLTWAKPGSSDEELWQALHLAAADEFVVGLPDGLDTVLGDRGVLLSGGERQRLSLARALLRQPALLVLDEATSSLDSENELRIQQAIDSLHQRMTIVIITHRLAAIRHADVIHVIDQARLVQSGTWDELSKDIRGRFHALCAAQGIDEAGGRRRRRENGLPGRSSERKGPVVIH
jgi:ATP-binding cassette subfamily C protein